MENEYDPRYQEGKIYKIVCNITNEIYIGSTIKTLNKRLAVHKKENCISRKILNRGDYKIELIKDYPCNSRWELEEEEGKYIRENECINIVIPHRTIEERQIYMKNFNKTYREENKEKRKQYIEQNREHINKKTREYYENNKEKKLLWNKTYREKNIEKFKEKITCECGALVNKKGLTRHRKTMKHIKLTECIIID
jgi:hypothetical protein